MFCCMLLYVHSSIAIILMGKRELVALLYLSPWCLGMVGWLFLAVSWGYLQFVIVVFPDHTHLLFLNERQPKPPGSLNALYWRQIFALDSNVVITQKLFSSHGGFLTNAMHLHRETIYSNKHTMIKQRNWSMVHR